MIPSQSTDRTTSHSAGFYLLFLTLGIFTTKGIKNNNNHNHITQYDLYWNLGLITYQADTHTQTDREQFNTHCPRGSVRRLVDSERHDYDMIQRMLWLLYHFCCQSWNSLTKMSVPGFKHGVEGVCLSSNQASPRPLWAHSNTNQPPTAISFNNLHPGSELLLCVTLTLSPEHQSARMSKITNGGIGGLTRSETGCFIAVPIWQQWASKG